MKKRSWNIFRLILINISALVLIWIVAEAVWLARSIHRGPFRWLELYSPHGFLQYTLNPDIDMDTFDLNCRTHVRTSRMGLRNGEFTENTQPGKIRIIAVGGSTTFGSHVSDNEYSYPSLLDGILKKRYGNDRIEVINAGVPGYNTNNSLIHLITRLVYYDPDILLVYHAINDIRDHTKYMEAHTPFDITLPVTCSDSTGLYVRNSLLYRALSFRKKSDITKSRRLGRKKRKRKSLTGDHSEAGLLPDARGIEIYTNNLASIIRICRQHSIMPVMILFPYPDSLRGSLAHGMISYVNMTGSETAVALDLYNNAMIETGRTENVPVLDPAIPHQADLWGDWCHVNDKGSRIMSANLADHLHDLIETVMMKDAGSVDDKDPGIQE